MVFVRDEYNAFGSATRLSFIKDLLTATDKILAKEGDDPPFAAFLLGKKAGLLRWRGRRQQSKEQQSSYEQSARSAQKSLTMQQSKAAFLQLGLTKYTQARSFSLAELDKYKKVSSDASLIIRSEKLNDFAAAIKYRPRYLRDMYDFEGAMDAYLRACDMGYQANMREFAFVFGEFGLKLVCNTPTQTLCCYSRR